MGDFGRPTIIYGLTDPRTGELRYVGKTVNSMELRLRIHLQAARSRKWGRPILRWIRSVVRSGSQPQIFEIETIQAGGDWTEAERFWIAYFRSVGASLCNITSGGDGASDRPFPAACLSPEFRARVGKQSKDRWATKREQIIEAQNAGKRNPNWRKANSERAKARWQDQNSPYWKVFLTHEARDAIRAKLASGMTGVAVAKMYGLSQSRVSQIKYGQ